MTLKLVSRCGKFLHNGTRVLLSTLLLLTHGCATPPKPQINGMTVTLEFSNRYQAVALPIQLWTRSWVTHVDFVLPDGRLLGATPTGVRIRKWTPPLHYERYSFTADASVVLGFAKAQLNRPYDYGGDLGYALKLRQLNDREAWFCSELVQAAALAAGVNLSGKAPRWTSPAQIKASPLLQRAG